MRDRTNTTMTEAARDGGTTAVASVVDPWAVFVNEIDVRTKDETKQQYWASVTVQGIAWNVKHGNVTASTGIRQILTAIERLHPTKQDAVKRLECAIKKE